MSFRRPHDQHVHDSGQASTRLGQVWGLVIWNKTCLPIYNPPCPGSWIQQGLLIRRRRHLLIIACERIKILLHYFDKYSDDKGILSDLLINWCVQKNLALISTRDKPDTSVLKRSRLQPTSLCQKYQRSCKSLAYLNEHASICLMNNLRKREVGKYVFRCRTLVVITN